MNIAIKHAADPEADLVRLADGREFSWHAWLKQTERAVTTLRHVFDTPLAQLSPAELAAARASHDWLVACGVVALSDFLDLELHLPLLKLPPDPSTVRHCRRCGSEIWGRESILTGLGSECRRIAVRAQRYLSTEAARVAVRTAQAVQP